jgi:hypothetical protein
MSSNPLISSKSITPILQSGLFLGGLYACCGVMSKSSKYQIIAVTALTASYLEVIRCAISCFHIEDFKKEIEQEYNGTDFKNRFKRIFLQEISLFCNGMLFGGISAIFGVVIAYAAQADFPILKLKAKITPSQLLPYQVMGKTAIWCLQQAWVVYQFQGGKEKDEFCQKYNNINILGNSVEAVLLVAAIILSRQDYFQWRPLSQLS